MFILSLFPVCVPNAPTLYLIRLTPAKAECIATGL
jgi:hypothetical protein